MPMLKFIRHAKLLQGLCVFTGDPENPFGNPQQISEKMVRELHDASDGPPRPGFFPHFSTNYHKGMPDSDEAIIEWFWVSARTAVKAVMQAGDEFGYKLAANS
jgi:ABC-type branched-subunit amino acid transport system substrate-binding protein